MELVFLFHRGGQNVLGYLHMNSLKHFTISLLIAIFHRFFEILQEPWPSLSILDLELIENLLVELNESNESN